MSVARKLAMAASKANYVYHAPNYGTFGSYMPDNSTTGHITPRAQLSPYNASGTTLTITSDNQLFESLEIFGDIVIKAKNTIFQDCLFRGPLTVRMRLVLIHSYKIVLSSQFYQTIIATL
jgi:hypothetical protein